MSSPPITYDDALLIKTSSKSTVTTRSVGWVTYLNTRDLFSIMVFCY